MGTWGRGTLAGGRILFFIGLILYTSWGCEGEHREYSLQALRGPDGGTALGGAGTTGQMSGAEDAGSTFLSGSRCVPNPCLNNGDCRGDGSCACTPGYSGERC